MRASALRGVTRFLRQLVVALHRCLSLNDTTYSWQDCLLSGVCGRIRLFYARSLKQFDAMLKISGKGSVTTCDGITRRDFLQVGTLGTIGFTLSNWAALKAMGAVKGGNDEKSAIMIFNLGAPSQLDT